MVQIKMERLTDKKCPVCGYPLQWWGARKHGMVICIVKECNNLIRYEEGI